MGEQPHTLYESQLHSLELVYRGKVRDLYAVGDDRLLMVATDRISAFDVILPTPIAQKGRLLTEISNFWFSRFESEVPNHLVDVSLHDVVADPAERTALEGRSVVARRLQALPVEAIVRGYLIGSGWKDYQASGHLCGLRLPEGLRQADRLPEPIFTPSSKAQQGEHDENIDFDAVVSLVGGAVANQVRDISLRLYNQAAGHALARGIIIADTKFEFGLDDDGRVVLMDEVLTPDSSRFWPLTDWQPGTSPPSFDKQFVRDYLETLDWDKTAPGPVLPSTVTEQTTAKYREAVSRLSGPPASDG